MEVLEKKVTPMMEQWQACKQKAKEAVLLFRMGDFYEAFYEDAALLAKECELTLTKRQEIPMSGVPCHAVESYVDRLVNKGFKVAIAEQMEDPKSVKGLVKREVVRIVTPGTALTSTSLSEKSNCYMVALTQVGEVFGLACIDMTTAEFKVMEFEKEGALFGELARIKPKECGVATKFRKKYEKELNGYFLTEIDEWKFAHEGAYRALTRHFKVHHLDGFGLKGKVAAINAAGALLSYLQEDLTLPLEHIGRLFFATAGQTLEIEPHSEHHLEVPQLLTLLDNTVTPMGGRLLRQWFKKPLLDVKKIGERHDALDELMQTPHLLTSLLSLKEVRDLERLMMKISTNFATARDFLTLAASLEVIPALKAALNKAKTPLLKAIKEGLHDLMAVVQKVRGALEEEPPLRLTEGNIFRLGYHSELDELRTLSKEGKSWIANYQNTLRQEHGIKNLKVTYNRAFGYLIEVSRGQAKSVPDFFEKRQTLINTERFTTEALREYEHKVLHAEESKIALELKLFHLFREEIAEQAEAVFETAHAVALLDVLLNFAIAAFKQNLVRPVIDESQKLEIVGGRHLLVEATLSREYFIANDTKLDYENERLMVITGPNMAGKSTYIRQVALIVLLAQIGSFVPARSAHIGLVDKIFTRIGAGDDLMRGQSTFMVEMSETANILNNVTSRSLVILDEIGRGTSTYDGLAIAWAVAEYLLTEEHRRAKTLFATHYCELTALEEMIPHAKNYHAAVKEQNDEILFLHKILPGKAEKSFGIHVGQLAGLPPTVIQRAKSLLAHLEQKNAKKESMQKFQEKIKERAKQEQLSLFS